MAKIITVSREFGSGGRELGKRIAEALGIPCYDHQIIEMVAEKQGLDPHYVEHISQNDLRGFYPTTIGRSFALPHFAMIQSIEIATAEHELLKELASAGDCVVVGRCADVVLDEMHPFNIFVCATDEAKLLRCRKKAGSDEHYSDRQLLRKMRDSDKRRRNYRAMFTDKKWGMGSSYHLSVNTTGKEIKDLVPAIVAYINAWFDADERK